MRKALLAIVLLSLTGCAYNRIQTLDERVNTLKSQIEVQLQRRADLIPNLVSTVRAIAGQEQEVFTAIANARSRLTGAIQSGDIPQMAQANQGMTSALGRLLVISEAYPELRSSENFRTLQDQLEGTENRIATARRDYNEVVGAYNTYIRRFPAVLTAKAIGAQARPTYEADESAQAVPTVDFNR